MQELPYARDYSKKAISDFIGANSTVVFDLLQIDTTFFSLPFDEWYAHPNYSKTKGLLEQLPVVNDAAERVLGLATEANRKTAPKSEDQQQALYKVIKGTRDTLKEKATSSERVTRKTITATWNALNYEIPSNSEESEGMQLEESNAGGEGSQGIEGNAGGEGSQGIEGNARDEWSQEME